MQGPNNRKIWKKGQGKDNGNDRSKASSRENPLRALLGDEAYYGLPALFTEVPFIRPMSRRGQLQAMIRYVQLNPQRLATKRLFPDYFRVQQGIEIAGRTYAGSVTSPCCKPPISPLSLHEKGMEW